MWIKFLMCNQKIRMPQGLNVIQILNAWPNIRMPQGLSHWENDCESCGIFKVK